MKYTLMMPLIGVSATLVQHSPDEDKWRVVQYASRALSDVEQRYSQIELDMLAVDFACRKFHVFLYGKPSTIFTDHKQHHGHNATENVGANSRLREGGIQAREDYTRIILRGTRFHVRQH